MRPLDVYTEKNASDGNHDKLACSAAFLNEMHSMSLPRSAQKHDKDDKTGRTDKTTGKAKSAGDFNDAAGMGQRDKLALASIAFCSPLMLLGIGAALGIADGFRSNKVGDLKDRPLQRVPQSVIEKSSDAPLKKAMLSMSLSEMPSLRTEARKSKLEYGNRKENVLYPANGLWRQADPERSWVKASKLVKRKQHLMVQLEKFRGMMELSLVSAIVAKIERLDKELKKMGC
jgi:hypothetical protein